MLGGVMARARPPPWPTNRPAKAGPSFRDCRVAQSAESSPPLKSPMKITSVRATPVSVPTTMACAWSLGVGFGVTRTVLELGTDEGPVGLGECGTSSVAALLGGKLGLQLIGLPVSDLAAAARICGYDSRHHGSISDPSLPKAYAAIEMAMLDLQGKAAGLPVFRLLGGAVRPKAEFGAYRYACHRETSGLAEKDVPAASAAAAAQAVAATGAGIYEFKIGRYSVDTDIESIRAVRAALGPDRVLGVDANQALTIDETRRLLRGLVGVRLDWFEEPVASLKEMTRLHGEFPHVALSGHCTDPEKMEFYPAIEGVVGDLHIQGGLRGLARSAAIFHALGHQFWQRSCLELGISWAAMVHVGMACPEISRGSQSLIDHMEDDLILGPPWLLSQGGVAAPEKPGLGVELDRAALDRYAETFRRQGEMTFFDQE